jgi:Flp pilus assembly secretin CpaC
MKDLLTLALMSLLAVGCQTTATDKKLTDAKPTAPEPLPSWTKSSSTGDSEQTVLIVTKIIEITRPLGDPETPTAPYRKEMTDPEMQVFIRGLSHRKGADLMTAPSVVARDGQSAKFEVIREFTYPTAPGEGAKTATENIGVTGYNLARPSTDKRTVQLKSLTEVCEFVGFSEVTPDFEMPVFQRRRAGSTVDVKDGGWVVFGGNVDETSQDVVDSGPLGLVKRHSTEKYTRELIVVVSPRLIDTNGTPIAALKPTQE